MAVNDEFDHDFVSIDDGDDDEGMELFTLVGDEQENPENSGDLFSSQVTGKARWDAEKSRSATDDDGFVSSDEDDAVEIGEGEDPNEKKPKKKGLKRFGRKRKPKNSFKETDEVVQIQDNSMDSFVILEEQGKTMWLVKSVVKYALFVAFFLLGIFITYMLMMYRFVPEHLMGAEWTVGNWSCIARDYQLPVDELTPGDVIASSKTPSLSPLVWDYELYYFHSSQGEIFTVTRFSDGLQERIEQGDVAYVVEGIPNKYDATNGKG